VLTHLHIRNLAVVDEAELELGPGLTVLTGETGAGKSILIDALALAMGERADSKAIRSNTDRLEVSATFDITRHATLQAWLTENDLSDPDSDGMSDAESRQECAMRRVVTAEGRSRGYLNGRSVPMQTLRDVGERLVDICGQQAHQSLRHRAVQSALLDSFGGLETMVDTIATAHRQWQQARTQLDELIAAQNDLESQRELLSYQSAELEALNLQPGEFAAIEDKFQLAANSGRIAEAIDRAVTGLYEGDDPTASNIISSAKKELQELARFDSELTAATQLLSEAEILVSEAAEALRRRSGTLEHDPAQQLHLEQRISSVLELARKHQVMPDELPALTEQLTTKLADLDNSEERIDELTSQADSDERQLKSLAKKLTKARHAAAESLAKQVTANMQSLGMPGGSFIISVEPLADGKIGTSGADSVEFRVSANPGQAAGALARVASGGELSRISLSLQVVALAAESVTTLIFDEVDSGVGGGVAEIVGQQLHDLGDQCQVLCVTHLPQVASQGDQHLRVSKISDGVATRTSVKGLTAPERVEEIARMLGGVKITQRTRAHAEEMLKTKVSRRAG
jgi:DNA repair protein RecN (Recombination protein N)